jgi:hypothetical protein
MKKLSFGDARIIRQALDVAFDSALSEAQVQVDKSLARLKRTLKKYPADHIESKAAHNNHKEALDNLEKAHVQHRANKAAEDAKKKEKESDPQWCPSCRGEEPEVQTCTVCKGTGFKPGT